LEAISRKKEVDEMKTFAKEIPAVGVTKTPTGVTINNDTSSGWNSITGTFLAYYETYFDLAGLSIDDKTLFFTGASTQNAYPAISQPAAPGNKVIIHDIMVTKPLTEAELTTISIYGNFENTVLTFDQTIYMRVRVLNTDLDNQAAAVMIPLFNEQLGSLEPTASDRIYCYRIIGYSGADGVYNTYPVRYLLRAEPKEEAEYAYLMRLKRSYELQQRPDRD
jgi:hypothetical protein